MRFCISFVAALMIVGIPLQFAGAQPQPLEKQFDFRVIGYVEKLLKDYDKNDDGVIDKEEWKVGKWSTPPEESDTDKDGALSKRELCVRIAKRFGLKGPEEAVATASVAKPAPRKVIAFEFVVIERPNAEPAGDKAPTAAQLLKLEKDGQAGNVQRFKLTALENVEARLQLGENAPFVSGRTRGFASGATQETITYHSIGTTINLTAETETEGKVLASLNLARSSVAAPPKAAEKTEGQETGVSANYPRLVSNTVVTTVRLTPGEIVVVAGQQTPAGTSPGELWVLVTARVE